VTVACATLPVPRYGPLTLGVNGVMYGTTTGGRPTGYRTVCEVTPPTAPAGAWTETVIHFFTGYPTDGGYPQGSLAIDANGVVYGDAGRGAHNCGVVFAATPPATLGGSWHNPCVKSPGGAGRRLDHFGPP
jgi:hypothetical protein